jgi:ferredoxin
MDDCPIDPGDGSRMKDPASMPRVVYLGDEVAAEVDPPGQTILGVSRKARVPHMSECGGRARCTTCRVRVLDGLANLSARTEAELVIAEARGIRALFRTTPSELQERMFVDMIWLAVRSLSRLEALTPALVELGARHADYGIEDAHFASNKRALIDTLREALGSRMTADAEAAWSQTHDVISAAMLRGMRSARPQ